MIIVEKIIFLRNVHLFSNMPLSGLEHLAGATEEAIYSAGESIIREGEYGDSMYLIVDGEVRIHIGEKELSVFNEKDYFGELSIIDGEPRSASASAHTDCLLLKINKEEFNEILKQHSDSALAIIQALTRDLRNERSKKTHE